MMWFNFFQLHKTRWNCVWVMMALGLAIWLGFSGCAAKMDEKTVLQGFLPQTPQPDAHSLKPGLAAIYFHKKFDHTDRFPSGRYAQRIGRPGPPILFLNHRFGDGEVFESKRKDEVGVQMNGFIKIDRPGIYTFMAQSNDGICVYISDKMVVRDPTVHGDRFSKKISIEILQHGWFPIEVRYFEKSHSAMIELYWKEPGKDNFEIVPAEAYAH